MKDYSEKELSLMLFRGELDYIRYYYLIKNIEQKRHNKILKNKILKNSMSSTKWI
jgi:hypothetical protein